MNAFVNRLLTEAAEADERGRAFDRRLADAGIRVVYPSPTRVPPTDEQLEEALRGSGTAILDELLAQRRRIR